MLPSFSAHSHLQLFITNHNSKTIGSQLHALHGDGKGGGDGKGKRGGGKGRAGGGKGAKRMPEPQEFDD